MTEDPYYLVARIERRLAESGGLEIRDDLRVAGTQAPLGAEDLR